MENKKYYIEFDDNTKLTRYKITDENGVLIEKNKLDDKFTLHRINFCGIENSNSETEIIRTFIKKSEIFYEMYELQTKHGKYYKLWIEDYGVISPSDDEFYTEELKYGWIKSLSDSGCEWAKNMIHDFLYEWSEKLINKAKYIRGENFNEGDCNYEIFHTKIPVRILEYYFNAKHNHMYSSNFNKYLNEDLENQQIKVNNLANLKDKDLVDLYLGRINIELSKTAYSRPCLEGYKEFIKTKYFTTRYNKNCEALEDYNIKHSEINNKYKQIYNEKLEEAKKYCENEGLIYVLAAKIKDMESDLSILRDTCRQQLSDIEGRVQNVENRVYNIRIVTY